MSSTLREANTRSSPGCPFEIDLVEHELLGRCELPDEGRFSDLAGAPNQ